MHEKAFFFLRTCKKFTVAEQMISYGLIAEYVIGKIGRG